MSPRNAASHGAAVMQHFLHRDGKRVFIAEHDHAERISDQDAVDSGAIQRDGRRKIVGGQERNRLSVQLLGMQSLDADFFPGRGCDGAVDMAIFSFE